jgi:hypothetical protein
MNPYSGNAGYGQVGYNNQQRILEEYGYNAPSYLTTADGDFLSLMGYHPELGFRYSSPSGGVTTAFSLEQIQSGEPLVDAFGGTTYTPGSMTQQDLISMGVPQESIYGTETYGVQQPTSGGDGGAPAPSTGYDPDYSPYATEQDPANNGWYFALPNDQGITHFYLPSMGGAPGSTLIGVRPGQPNLTFDASSPEAQALGYLGQPSLDWGDPNDPNDDIYTYPETPPPTGGPSTGQPGTGNPVDGGPTPPTTPPVAPPPTEEILDPITNEPTDDWYWTDPVGYENAPQPDGDGEFVEGGPPLDTSWDWSFFRDRAPGDRQWGGYDEDYQAFERYVPGMDSPWGLPNVEGGNEDFYQQQFLNQLRDEQGYQNRERAAQMRRQESLANPQESVAPEDMWSWAYGGQGLPDVQMGGSAPAVNWDLNAAFTPGQSTNEDILRWASSGDNSFSQKQRNWYQKLMEGGDQDSTIWSSAGDPNTLIGYLPTDTNELTSQNQQWMTELFNSIYNQGQAGPYAPSGYASPVNQQTFGG